MRPKWYIGFKGVDSVNYDTFQSDKPPTPETHSQYISVAGPYKSLSEAESTARGLIRLMELNVKCSGAL